MATLKLKAQTTLNSGGTYSIVLRGARIFDKSETIGVETEDHKKEAKIESAAMLRFCDLEFSHYYDNYDCNCQHPFQLGMAMRSIYPNFVDSEIVTVLRFTIL